MTQFIFMGVSGCGKSTIGRAASQRLGLPFIEADNFHPKANIDKMSRGVPLTDHDRGPWIDALIARAKEVEAQKAQPHSVMACSGLSQFVRDRLRAGLTHAPDFIHLSGPQDVISARLKARIDHFFDPALLASQFAALSLPDKAFTLDISLPVDQLVDLACVHIQSQILRA